MKRIRTMTAALLAAAAFSAMMFGSGASAAPVCVTPPTGRPVCIDVPGGQDPVCDKQRPPTGEDGHDPLCPNGPSECIAYGAYIATDPAPGAPMGARTHLARSHAAAQAGGWYGYGYGQSDADSSTQRADVPPALGEGVVESECHAWSYGQQEFFSNYAWGRAETARLALDLNSYGVPVTVSADVLHERGFASTGGFGSNDANIADVSIVTPFGALVLPASASPNTAIPLPGGLGTVYLNEQSVSVSPFGCLVFSGDALRLVVNRPGIGGQVTVIVSWVANAAC